MLFVFSFKRYNNLVELHEGYISHTRKLTNAQEVFEKANSDGVQSYRDMLKDFRRNSLRNTLPEDLVKDSTLAEIMKLSKLNIEI
jgi:predicted acetyltransferase